MSTRPINHIYNIGEIVEFAGLSSEIRCQIISVHLFKDYDNIMRQCISIVRVDGLMMSGESPGDSIDFAARLVRAALLNPIDPLIAASIRSKYKLL